MKNQSRTEIQELLSKVPQGTPEFQMLLLQYFTLLDGKGVEIMREYANKQLVLIGLKQPESKEEQQQGQPDAAMIQAQGVLLQGQADLKKAQNDEARIQVDAFKAQTDAQVSAAKVIEILALADSTKKQDVLAALKLLGDFQHRQGDSARADAEVVFKGQGLIHSHRKEITSLMRQTNLPAGGVAETPQ